MLEQPATGFSRLTARTLSARAAQSAPRLSAILKTREPTSGRSILNPPPASISMSSLSPFSAIASGTDTNANGIQNPGEPGVSGVTVRLWSDADGDPNTTFDQVLEDTVQTAFNGSYLFYVTPGEYYFVEFDAVGALTLAKQGGNDAEDSDADPATGRTAIITPLTDDEQFLDLDAGLIEQDVDWGDAADPSYPTLASSAGARHIISSALYLGACVDSEARWLTVGSRQWGR